MEEIWKDIKGTNGNYQISNKGRVKSLIRNTPKIMRLKDWKGYKKVGIRIDGKQKDYRVHRLVAEAFIPNPNNLSNVNHKDYNRDNNVVDNLEWSTHDENAKHREKKQLENVLKDNVCPKCLEIIKNLGIIPN